MNTKEIASQADKISKSSTFNQVTVLHQQKEPNDVHKLNKYKRKLKKYLTKNKELTADLSLAKSGLERA